MATLSGPQLFPHLGSCEPKILLLLHPYRIPYMCVCECVCVCGGWKDVLSLCFCPELGWWRKRRKQRHQPSFGKYIAVTTSHITHQYPAGAMLTPPLATPSDLHINRRTWVAKDESKLKTTKQNRSMKTPICQNLWRTKWLLVLPLIEGLKKIYDIYLLLLFRYCIFLLFSNSKSIFKYAHPFFTNLCITL